jgi:hypothetical protein
MIQDGNNAHARRICQGFKRIGQVGGGQTVQQNLLGLFDFIFVNNRFAAAVGY